MATRTLAVVIAGDSSGARSAFRDVEQGADGLRTKLAGVGQSMMRFGGMMTAGVTLPLVLLGKSSFDAASDLNESMSKVNMVFAENAAEIKKWSKTSAEAMGISRQEALEAAGTFGNLFSAMKIGPVLSKDMSKNLVQLASDLASFNNENPEDVLIALRAGLLGETEPMRRFGSTLSATRVEMRALELAQAGFLEGLLEQDGEITASAKAQAAYSLILEDTALAQGDFARTADGAANKQRILSAKFKDAMALLGQSLIPIFQKLATVVAKVADWFSNLDPKIQQFAVYAGIAAAAIGPVVLGLGGLITVLTAVSLPVLVIGGAIAALVAATVLLYLKWDEVWNWMKDHPAIAALILLITGPVTLPIIALVGVIRFLQQHWDTIWPAIQATVEAVWSVVGPILYGMDAVIKAIADAVVWLAAVAKPYFDDFVRGAKVLWEAIDGPLGALLSILKKISSAAETVGSVFNKGGIADVLPQEETGGIGGGSRQFRASGGPVDAGKLYRVNENGTEWFRPSGNGMVIPLGGAGAGGPQSIVIPVHVGGRQVAEVVASELNRPGGPKITQKALVA